MIRIDNISFDFSMADESFAHGLYAGWDEFCRECFEKVVEECLSEYEKQKIWIAIDSLDVQLGSIPEEEFYQLFPVRLREELQRKFHTLVIREEQEVQSWETRLENLVYYLTNGFCRTEWADADFNVTEELGFLLEHIPQRMNELVYLCFSCFHALERLMAQTDNITFVQLMVQWYENNEVTVDEKQQVMAHLAVVRSGLVSEILKKAYGYPSLFFGITSLIEAGLQSDRSLSPTLRVRMQLRILEYLPGNIRRNLLEEWKESMLWLLSPDINMYEKRRYLGLILESKPEIPVRFIHETTEESHLDTMADILDSVVVKQIMITESESHTDVDVPQYWHYLYDWLLEHYPFNGIAMFGDKRQFRKHLNRKLLSFIRKRSVSDYLSKTELTILFLQEVFGHEYYLDVLNKIYNCQPHDPDGSPVYSGYLNMELYHIFLKLSFLKQPFLLEKNRNDLLPNTNEVTVNDKLFVYDSTILTAWLTNVQRSREEKLSFLKKMVKEQPAVLLEWIYSIKGNKEAIILLAEITDSRFVYELIISISFDTAETFNQIEDYLYANALQIVWLSGINKDKLSFFIRKSMFRWIAIHKESVVSIQEYIEWFMRFFYQEVTGRNSENEANSLNETEKLDIKNTIQVISMQLHLTDHSINKESKKQLVKTAKEKMDLLSQWIERLSILLRDRSVSDSAKRRALARLLEKYRNEYDRIIQIMQTNGLLKDCIAIMHPVLLEQLAIQLVIKANGCQNLYLLTVYQWILAHDILFMAFLPEKKEKLVERMLKLLAQWSIDGSVSGKGSDEIVRFFLIELFGREHTAEALCLIYQELMRELSGKAIPENMYKTEFLLNLLFRITDDFTLQPIWKGNTFDIIQAVRENSLLFKEQIENLSSQQFERLVVILLEQANSRQSTNILSFYHWMVAHASLFNTTLSIISGGQKKKLVLLLAQWNIDGTVSGKNEAEIVELLLTGLFGKENSNRLLWAIHRELESESLEDIPSDTIYDTKKIGVLLQMMRYSVTTSNYITGSDFTKWLQQEAKNENNLQTAFEKYLNSPANFLIWLKDNDGSRKVKYEVLQAYATIHPHDFVLLIQKCPNDAETINLLSNAVDSAILLAGIARINIAQAEVLVQICELLQRKPEVFSIIGSIGKPISKLLSEALLCFMLNEINSNSRVLSPEELIRQFVFYLHRTYTGQHMYQETEIQSWKQIEYRIANELGLHIEEFPEKISKQADLSVSDLKNENLETEFIVNRLTLFPIQGENIVIQRDLAFILEYYPKQFIFFIEKEVSREVIEKLSEQFNHLLLEKWVAILITCIDSSHLAFFRRYMRWLVQYFSNDTTRISFVRILFLWMKKPAWRTETPEQITAFFSHLYDRMENFTFNMSDEVALSDWLNNPKVATSIKQRILRLYILEQPQRFLKFVCSFIIQQIIPINRWKEWLDEKDWLRLLAGISVSQAETLQQVIDYLLEKQIIGTNAIWNGLVVYLTGITRDIRSQKNTEEIVKQFITSLDFTSKKIETGNENRKADSTQKELIQKVKTDLKIMDAEQNNVIQQAEEPEFILVSNAGLSLLSPWFPRLFGMLGLLNEDKTDFKDMESRIRAIFILQYLVFSEEKEYKEQELAFNRVLVSCPFSIPLPKQLKLTLEEKDTVDSMLAGVKANWSKMQNTSVKGFQHNFIERGGRMEQQEEKWVLTVDEHSYDILLNSLPWSYKLIRFTWLKKQIHVSWHSKEKLEY